MSAVLSQSPALDPDAPEALWAIGGAAVADGFVEYPLSNRDVEADAAWAERQLAALGVGKGSLVDFIHNYRECGHFWPYYVAAYRLGAPAMNGMATPWDVARTEMYARRFDLALIMGVAPETVEGLASFGHDPVKVLERPACVAARGAAVAALAAGGREPHALTLFGPMILISAPGQTGAVYDASQWTVEADEAGRLLVSTKADRAARYDRLDTGFTGRVEDGRVHLDPC